MASRKSFNALDGKEISYELLKQIGSGAFGVACLANVWLPNSSSKASQLVVKTIKIPYGPEEYLEKTLLQLNQEKLPSLLELEHKNLVKYFAAGACPPASLLETGQVLLIMEYCSGKVSADCIKVTVTTSTGNNIQKYGVIIGMRGSHFQARNICAIPILLRHRSL